MCDEDGGGGGCAADDWPPPPPAAEGPPSARPPFASLGDERIVPRWRQTCRESRASEHRRPQTIESIDRPNGGAAEENGTAMRCRRTFSLEMMGKDEIDAAASRVWFRACGEAACV